MSIERKTKFLGIPLKREEIEPGFNEVIDVKVLGPLGYLNTRLKVLSPDSIVVEETVDITAGRVSDVRRLEREEIRRNKVKAGRLIRRVYTWSPKK